ncbi:hypothetical protein BC826DRAFT_908730 [Russula brevipes]|nr:hypothetical protein BC826DRAFT_908730 [Russula brevipes]
MVNGRPAWVLDYAIRSGGPVVPQQLWIPHSQGDFRRYVGQASLHLPVFFLNRDGRLGVPVTNAVAGEMSLRAAMSHCHLEIELRSRSAYVFWPGYRPSEQQIQLKDQTPARNPISFERFVRHLGSRVRQFLVDCERVPISQLDPNSKWILGRGRISVNEVVLIGIVHVSAGSWMPILQLGSSRDTRPDGNSPLLYHFRYVRITNLGPTTRRWHHELVTRPCDV